MVAVVAVEAEAAVVVTAVAVVVAVVVTATELLANLAEDVVAAEAERLSSTTTTSQLFEPGQQATPALREVKVKYLSLSHAHLCSRTLQSAY